MRVQDIRVGTRCFTKVGMARVEVEVIQDRGGNGRRYVVKRCDNGLVLAGKLRAASALHATKGGAWTGAFAPAEPSPTPKPLTDEEHTASCEEGPGADCYRCSAIVAARQAVTS